MDAQQFDRRAWYDFIKAVFVRFNVASSSTVEDVTMQQAAGGNKHSSSTRGGGRTILGIKLSNRLDEAGTLLGARALIVNTSRVRA